MENIVDAHIHFEKQEYSLEIVDKMVETAIKNRVNDIHLLDHTHKFKEFSFLYNKNSLDENTFSHFENRHYISIQEYLDFIKIVKQKSYPIKIKFGLEVCYFKQYEKELKNELEKYDFDFLIGSVHFVDGFGYDYGKELWLSKDIDELYRKFFEQECNLIKSKLFDHLAHPDAIKIYDYFPSFSLIPYYEKVAKLLSENNMSTENNSGFARYGFTNYGLNEDFYRILKENNVKIFRSSDAHKYENIGAKFNELKV